MNFQKQPKRNFNLTEEKYLEKLNQNLKNNYYITWTNFRSFYLKNEDGDIIGRWSNHQGGHGEEYSFINSSNNFKNLINNFKKFTQENNLIKIQWNKFKQPKKESISEYLFRIKKEQELKNKGVNDLC